MKTEILERLCIREASLEEILQVHQLIPEFPDKVSLGLYQEQLANLVHLALIAEANGDIVGFKVGYQSEITETFYSWMGGVLPEFRKLGVANALAEVQESWARQKGFKNIFFKTRNRFPGMISFGLKRGFKIMKVIPKGGVEDYRIVMMKSL